MSGHVGHAIMLIEKKASVLLPLYKADPKPFLEEMEKIEQQFLGDRYQKKDIVVANSDDYGEKEEEEEESKYPNKSTTAFGGFGGNPFGNPFGVNAFVSKAPSRPAKGSYKVEKDEK